MAPLRGQIRIYAEFLKQPEDALRIGQLAAGLPEATARYVAFAETGRQLSNLKRYAEARDWLERAMR